MSYYETHIGKIRKVDLGNLTLEDYCEQRVKDMKLEFNPSYHNSYKDVLLELYPTKFIENDGELWEILDDTNLENDSDINFFKRSGNEYDYVMRYYNGGTYLGELLTEEINKLKKKNDR